MTHLTVSPLTTHQPWADQLCEWLPELGDTADAIAVALAERGFTGERECADRCPLANYVRHRLGVAAEHLLISVDITEVEIRDGARWADVSYGPAGEFVERFDAGDWSQLIADDDEDWAGTDA